MITACFAHGFCTLEPDCEVFDQVDAYCDPTIDLSPTYDNADLGIAWPVASGSEALSPKDRELSKLHDQADYF